MTQLVIFLQHILSQKREIMQISSAHISNYVPSNLLTAQLMYNDFGLEPFGSNNIKLKLTVIKSIACQLVFVIQALIQPRHATIPHNR